MWEGLQSQKELEEGIDDFRTPLPLVFPLPVCLSPSLLHSFHGWSVHLAGRKACCFDASSRDQRGRPCPRAVPTSAESTTISPPSLLKALRLRDYSCVSLYASGSGQISQGVPRTHTHTHTHTHVPTGRKRYWICRSSSGQWESRRKFDNFLKFSTYFFPTTVLHHTTLNFFTLGNFVQLYFNLLFWMCQSKQTISAFSCKVICICVGEFWTVFGICFWGADSEPDSKDKRNVAGLFWSLVFCLFYLLSLC